MRNPTIYEALKSNLNREPLNSELKAEVARILNDGVIELAGSGKLSHQRKRSA